MLRAVLIIAVLLGPVWANAQCPLVIAHRGASGDRPEHTIAAYRLAIEQGADFIEPDLVPTADGVLVARHENVLARLSAPLADGGEVEEATTNVADIPAFVDKVTTKTLYGREVTGWFVEDFTLAELRRIKARERLPEVRPGNVQFNDQESIPTLAEVVALARHRNVGVYPEMKRPGYFADLGVDVAALLANALKDLGFTDPSRVFVQSFEPASLQRFKTLWEGEPLPLVQLLGRLPEGQTAAEALSGVGEYADALGPSLMVLVDQAFAGAVKATGLPLHIYTLRKEAAFMPPGADFDQVLAGIQQFGVDGIFTDHPGDLRQRLACSR